MRVYPIVYDEDSKDVEPFVYAQDMSSNGHNTWLHKKAHSWEPYILSKGVAVLLSHGDGLRLCDGTTFVYDSQIRRHEPSLERDELREFEKEVGLSVVLLTLH